MPRRTRKRNQLVIDVGARIRDLRLERGLSLQTLARLADCCVSGLCLLETGRTSSTTTTLGRIARALEVELFDLFNHDPHDDAGYVIETMRRDPESMRIVKAAIMSAV